MSFLKEYTLLGELGTGSFAKVYKVRHNELDYIRAIRVLNETVVDENSRTYQKFLRECKVLLRLGNGSHRNIVHIYQPRFLENHALVEMDYVDGKDIAHYLKDNGNFVPAQEVINMVLEISSALAYCHEDIYRFCMDREVDNLQDDPVDGNNVLIDEPTRQRLIDKYKVIHNDIHSGNIMRREDGSFILLDFGLAITGDDDVRSSSRHDNGAVEFKPPEKWDNDAVLTEQSDIYSFGILAYEYLAGRVPFPFDKNNREESAYLLRKAHLNNLPPSIYEFRKSFFEAKNSGVKYEKDYPDWLNDLIMKCLEKNPQDRFRNGKELYEFVKAHIEEDKAFLLKQADLEVENELLKEKNTKFESVIANMTIKEKDLENRLARLQRELETQQNPEDGDNVEALKSQLDSKQKNIDELYLKVQSLEDENSHNKTLIGDLRNDKSKLLNDNQALQQKISGIKSNGGKGKKILILFCIILSVLSISFFILWNRSMTSAVSNVTASNGEYETKILSDSIANQQKKIDELNMQLEDAKKHNDSLQIINKDLQDKNNEMLREVIEL